MTTRQIDMHAIDIKDLLTPVVVRAALFQSYAYCTLAEFMGVTAQWMSESANDADADAEIGLDTLADDIDVVVWSNEWAENMCTCCGVEITEKEKK